MPDPRQVFAVALNYRPHAAEAGFTAPDAPLVFTKFPSCITGPVTTVALPPSNVDWEIGLSAICPLLPDDLISTGVGNRRTPQRFLQPGETLISHLDGVGELRQTFTA